MLRNITQSEMVVDAEMFWLNEQNPCVVKEVKAFGEDEIRFKLAKIECNGRTFYVEDKELFVSE